MYRNLRIFAIIMTCACMLAIGFCFLEEVEKSYKYTIRTENGLYRTNSFEKIDGGCIELETNVVVEEKKKAQK